jgi:hypothetical protein
MLASRVKFAVLVAICMCAMTACPPAVEVTVYNNTPGRVTITWIHGRVSELESHSATTLPFPPVLERFSVVIAGSRREYTIHYPGKEFMYPTYKYGLQIQPTAVIFAVRGAMPTMQLAPQPPGYPLVPR